MVVGVVVAVVKALNARAEVSDDDDDDDDDDRGGRVMATDKVH